MRRNELLDAAEALLGEQGAQALTLAAVAQASGVSKGGLLYHFNSKDALIKGLVERLIADFDQLMAEQAPRLDTYTKRYVGATFAVLRTGRVRRWAVVTGAAGDPELLAPLRAAMARWHSEGLAGEPDPAVSEVVRLACEGVWEVASHTPELYSAEHYRDLEGRLLAMLG
ncbi:TetR/AcrR family transcriptional regulator [Spongiactinospora sp. TRM90649]|uniref:TetR/AcrR family transcriptional regulator n=1 Tax=Spongiactinospora sp. TRM90649 TaxID=3031114 RepID=UPI0023F76790|nr:TetR/AcrR family transcriptional regulator [Spongiactinospora sp. TRM90649]MDF5753412.1 TetR/AcrR family transcriptional regulator [Spongiactinospora sp. TRM90649]